MVWYDWETIYLIRASMYLVRKYDSKYASLKNTMPYINGYLLLSNANWHITYLLSMRRSSTSRRTSIPSPCLATTNTTRVKTLTRCVSTFLHCTAIYYTDLIPIAYAIAELIDNSLTATRECAKRQITVRWVCRWITHYKMEYFIFHCLSLVNTVSFF